MKHYSASLLERATRSAELQTDADLLARLRARLEEPGGKTRLMRELGVTRMKLTGILRGRWPIDDQVAAGLGFRRVMRFERTS